MWAVIMSSSCHGKVLEDELIGVKSCTDSYSMYIFSHVWYFTSHGLGSIFWRAFVFVCGVCVFLLTVLSFFIFILTNDLSIDQMLLQ